MAHDKDRYRRTCTLIEFLIQVAAAMEVAGELNESLSDRVDELIGPIRNDREWLRFVGSFIIRGGPLPGDFDNKLDAVGVRAFEAAPKLRLMVLEAFERHI
jgi:hypothetical protein